MKVLTSLLAALVLAFAPVLADEDEPGGGVCVGTMAIKACVPPETQTA